jgi:hypothetical protein
LQSKSLRRRRKQLVTHGKEVGHAHERESDLMNVEICESFLALFFRVALEVSKLIQFENLFFWMA